MGVCRGFAENPYVMISRIIRNENCTDEIDQTILHDSVPHVAELLSSGLATLTEGSCGSRLCDILSSFIFLFIEWNYCGMMLRSH